MKRQAYAWIARFALALFVMAGATAAASAETRSLKLFYLHTGEKSEITFKKNGRYLQSGLNQLNRFLRDFRRNEPTKMDPRLFDLVWEAYRQTGSREYIHVVSGYRSPATNAMLRRTRGGQAKKSQHMLGRAMDFFIPGVRLSKLRAIGMKLQGGGVGYYPRSGSPFVHLDVAGVRAWPRMSRSELASLFPDGKTLHLPTDGKPLPGYNQAMAEYKRRKGEPVRIDNSTQVASNTPSRRGKGLLASLFGGADEDEEASGEVAVIKPKARPAPAEAVAAAPAVVAEPVEAAPPPAPTPETIIASLSRKEVPMPSFAPRDDGPSPVPSLGVGETAAPAVAEAQAVEEPQVALDIPVPTRRPAYQAVPLPADQAIDEAILASNTDAGSVLTSVAPQPRPQNDSAAMLAALTNADVDPLPATLVPVPGKRPRVTKTENIIVAALPESRPSLADLSNSGKASRVTSSPRLAIEGASTPSERTALVLSGAHATRKDARPDASSAKPDPRPVIQPIKPDSARWALQAAAIPQPSSPPRATQNLRAAPSTVVAGGFEPASSQAQANRFTGKAVTFLSVVKFQ